MPTQQRRSDWHILVVESEDNPRLRELILVDRPVYQTLAIVFGVVVCGTEDVNEVIEQALRSFDTEVVPASQLPLMEFRKVLKQLTIPGLVIPEGLDFDSATERLIWETGLCQEVIAEHIKEIAELASKIDE